MWLEGIVRAPKIIYFSQFSRDFPENMFDFTDKLLYLLAKLTTPISIYVTGW
jgi:hypothetical protein